MTLWTVPAPPEAVYDPWAASTEWPFASRLDVTSAHAGSGSEAAPADDYEYYEPAQRIVVALEPAATSPFMDA
jgi:hypothetical protein